MSDGNDLSLGCIWGVVMACCVASVGYVIAFRTTQTHAFKPLPEGSLGKQTDSSQQKEISLGLSRYVDLVENARLELSIINSALKTCSLEARALVNNHKHSHPEKKYVCSSISEFSYFQASKEQISLLREQAVSDDLVRVYQELVQSYPLYTHDSSKMVKDIELACATFEDHHSKVLESATLMLPSLYGLFKNRELVAEKSNSPSLLS
jgi:hypothetical protein